MKRIPIFKSLRKLLLGKAGPDETAPARSTRKPEKVGKAKESLKLTVADRACSLEFLRDVLASEIAATANFEVKASLVLQRTKTRWIPGNLNVNGNLFANGCQRLCGFSGDSLRVSKDLVIGGSSDPRSPWLGDYLEAKNQYGQRVSEFLSKPSTSATCPFSTWPKKVRIGGCLSITNCKDCTSLPIDLRVGESISLVNCGITSLPKSLHVDGDLVIDSCPITELPHGLVVTGNLRLRNLPISQLPNMIVGGSLEIIRCPNLNTIRGCVNVSKDLKIISCNVAHIEDSFRVENRITIRNCPITNFLLTPRRCSGLSLLSCDQLESLSKNIKRKIELNALVINNCKSFSSLPKEVHVKSRCQLSNLPSLRSLPLNFSAPSFDITGIKLEHIHDSQLSTLRFVYRGIPIPAYAIFAPHKISVEEVLQRRNAEVRRMMLEQMGIERFETECQSMSIDEDTDAGGKRSLLRIQPQRWGPNRTYLMCRCPSTTSVYLLQVPGNTSTCHAAAAWLAGFDNPDDYQPLIET